MKITIYHNTYGCDTGCCGHIIEYDGKRKFFFSHPYGEDHKEFAEDLIREEFGEEHVEDLDWENCIISDD
jgi:hypothetical protein